MLLALSRKKIQPSLFTCAHVRNDYFAVNGNLLYGDKGRCLWDFLDALDPPTFCPLALVVLPRLGHQIWWFVSVWGTVSKVT